ncbi:MAG: lipoyl synthase, partial [Dehalococcoidia bacterium]
TINAIHNYHPGIMVEALIPDFGGSLSALKTVTDASLAVLNHNVETVPRLYSEVRPQADYQRSLEVISSARLLNPALRTKSGLMVGLGETRDEVVQVMADLRHAGCDLLTIGQYLAPSIRHHELVRFVHPDEFAEYQNEGERMGFQYVAAGPLVRSSFHAGEAYIRATESQP